MLKKITSSIALCTLLTCFHAAAENTPQYSPCESGKSENPVYKKARANTLNLTVMNSEFEPACDDSEAERTNSLLETLESRALLHKKLPESLLAVR